MWRRESVGKRLVAANAEIDRLLEALEQLRKADLAEIERLRTELKVMQGHLELFDDDEKLRAVADAAQTYVDNGYHGRIAMERLQSALASWQGYPTLVPWRP